MLQCSYAYVADVLIFLCHRSSDINSQVIDDQLLNLSSNEEYVYTHYGYFHGNDHEISLSTRERDQWQSRSYLSLRPTSLLEMKDQLLGAYMETNSCMLPQIFELQTGKASIFGLQIETSLAQLIRTCSEKPH